MSQSIVTQIVEQVHDLPDPLQQQVLTFILNLRQQSPKPEPNAWDILEGLTGTIENPLDTFRENS
jgi:hypothetical protein